MALTISERAANEVKRIISDQKLPDSTLLRVAVIGGGCSGFEYRLNFDATANESEDVVLESHGIRVAVDQRSLHYLRGTEIDIHEGLDKRGFVFNNPLAVKTCGCGSSFQV